MRLTNDNFSYCKGVGLLKENFTRERALKSIYNDMAETPDLDRAFLREVGKATTTSSNVGTWVAVMYNYDIDVNYKKGGKTYNKKINDFGNTGTPDELDVTEYYGDGDYKTLTDVASQCSFPVWNKNNIFTFEEMKGALKSIIEDELPSGGLERFGVLGAHFLHRHRHLRQDVHNQLQLAQRSLPLHLPRRQTAPQKEKGSQKMGHNRPHCMLGGFLLGGASQLCRNTGQQMARNICGGSGGIQHRDGCQVQKDRVLLPRLLQQTPRRKGFQNAYVAPYRHRSNHCFELYLLAVMQ